jgi:hypothetical protein
MRPTQARPATRLGSAMIAIALVALAADCSGPQQTGTPPTETPSSVSIPTASPIPAPTRIVLVAPAESASVVGAEFLAQTQASAQELAAEAHLELAEVGSLPDDEVTDVALVLALPPDPGLQAWSASHPTVRILSLGIPGMEPGPNLSVIAPEGLRYDQLGFALGYLAAMVTPEYRLGALPLDASPPDVALARGFVAGGTYYCGLCRPIHPPYVQYPAYLSDGLGDLTDGTVSTLLVAPQVESLSQLGLPTNSGMAFVGVDVPAPELTGAWIASAHFDIATALSVAWGEAQAGKGGTALALGIQFHSVNESAVSEGRLKLAEALLPDLTAGVIDTGVDPLTGELR